MLLLLSKLVEISELVLILIKLFFFVAYAPKICEESLKRLYSIRMGRFYLMGVLFNNGCQHYPELQ